MIIKYKSNLATGIAALIFSAVLAMVIPSQIAVESVVSYGVTSRSIPYGIAILIAVCGVALIVQSLVLKKDKEATINLKSELYPASLFVMFIIYINVFEKDWFLSTATLACTALGLSKCKKWYFYLITIALAGVMYCIFTNVLHIRLKSVIF